LLPQEAKVFIDRGGTTQQTVDEFNVFLYGYGTCGARVEEFY
jgi:hypothetical protein